MVANILNETTYNHYLRELIRLEKANNRKGNELEKFEIASVDFIYSNAININSLGKCLDRLQLRKDILGKIKISRMTEESYEKMYKALLKVEHGLVV